MSKAILNLFSDDFEMGKFITREKGNPQLLDTLDILTIGIKVTFLKLRFIGDAVKWDCLSVWQEQPLKEILL